jgi:hypothetical protein
MEGDLSMNALWIAVAVGIVAALARWMASARKYAGRSGLGFVSRQWIEDHRLL